MSWLETLAATVEFEGAAARAVIISTEGPTPRAVGSDMIVSRGRVDGRIGRGEVQRRAVEVARKLIDRLQQDAAGKPLWLRAVEWYGTGEVLGEGTGGRIAVLIEAFGRGEIAELFSGRQPDQIGRPLESGKPARAIWSGKQGDLPVEWRVAVASLEVAPHRKLTQLGRSGEAEAVIETVREVRPPFYVYGTGLVARALVGALVPLPFDVVWIDTAPGHFPSRLLAGIAHEVADDIAVRAGRGAPNAYHAVMTAAHDTDLSVCRAVLMRGSFAYLGVIGSALKRERMLERFRREGIAEADLARVSCPIGLRGLRSKSPPVIAAGIAAEALLAMEPLGATTI